MKRTLTRIFGERGVVRESLQGKSYVLRISYVVRN